MADSWDLEGAIVAITGASSGIGAAMAEAFWTCGAHVLSVSRRPTVDGRTYSERFTHLAADLSKRDETDGVVTAINAEHGAVDVLINNAGSASRAPAIDYPIDDWDRILELNVTAPFLLSRGLAPGMIAAGRGKIIFTASLWSFLGGRNVVAYTVSKSAIAGAIRALSREWANSGIQVNGIAPGFVETDLTRPTIEDPTLGPQFLARIPTGRWGKPNDVTGAALFLASRHSDYITGTILPVDGGWLAN